jgi:DUF1680 family protein
MTALAKHAWWWAAFVVGVCGDDAVEAQAPRLQPVPFSAVDIRSEFWVTRQRVNREKTIPHLYDAGIRSGDGALLSACRRLLDDATSAEAVYVNQYLESVATLSPGTKRLRVTQKSRYPWDGRVTLTVEPQPPPWHGEICLRIPDWSRRFESTGNLYQPRPVPEADAWTVRVNGRAIPPAALRRGYLVLRREWAKGDVIELSLPMPILRITSHRQVVANRGRVALQRGPVVYCIEAVDHGGRTRDIVLPPATRVRAEHRPDLLAGATVLQGDANRLRRAKADAAPVRLFAIPYAVWGNRAVGEMDVWLPEEPEAARKDIR